MGAEQDGTASQALADKTAKPKCFVMMPISDHPDYQLGHFRRVYDNLLAPAVRTAGFDPVLAGELPRSHVIHASILNHLLNAEMAVCDISSHNPNVFFELGIRQSFDKPVVVVNDQEHDPVFDTSILQYISYSRDLRCDHVVAELETIRRAIKGTFDDPSLNSIVKVLSVTNAAQLQTDINVPEETMKMVISRLERIEERLIPRISGQRFDPWSLFDVGFQRGSEQHRATVKAFVQSLGADRQKGLQDGLDGLEDVLRRERSRVLGQPHGNLDDLAERTNGLRKLESLLLFMREITDEKSVPGTGS